MPVFGEAIMDFKIPWRQGEGSGVVWRDTFLTIFFFPFVIMFSRGVVEDISLYSHFIVGTDHWSRLAHKVERSGEKHGAGRGTRKLDA